MSATEPSGRPLALVTGASSGIGLALADELAQRGYDLVIAADEPQIDAAADAIAVRGGDVQPVQIDLATEEGVRQLAEEVVGRDALEVVCLNAGIGVRGEFIATDLAEHLRVVDLNVRGVVLLAGLVLPPMAARGHGRLLITSSIAAEMAGPQLSTYNASKTFLLSFAEALHQELEARDVAVTALMPGGTDTRFFERAHMEDSKLAQEDKDDPADVAADAVDALLAGDAKVIPGSFKNKVLAAASAVLPDAVVGRAHVDQVESKPKGG
ncbi:MAG TPA: SDR family NAD(P)-dependent oxidoreductase [Acidimicrobiales bacterium]|nr:SDR family NAD(P)-dependent oxidoreductase [Acidimicrobiales bacterium]